MEWPKKVFFLCIYAIAGVSSPNCGDKVEVQLLFMAFFIYICYMDSLILLIDMAVTLSGNMEDSTLEKKREAILAQNDVVRKIPKEIYNLQTMAEKIQMKEEMKDAEIERNFKKFPERSTQGLQGNKLRDALFNRGQRIRILLTFYINKLAGGKTKPRSSDLKKAKRYYENEPDAALNDLITENGKDIHSLKAVLGLYSDSEIKKIQRKKKFGIGGRKSRKKRGKGMGSSKHMSARNPKNEYLIEARRILNTYLKNPNVTEVEKSRMLRNLALNLEDDAKDKKGKGKKGGKRKSRRKTRKRRRSRLRKSRRKRR